MSTAKAAAVNSTGVETLLVNGVCAFFIKSMPVLSNSPKFLQRNLSDCAIFDSWVFNNFILADKLLEKPHQALKLVYQLAIIYAEN